jgi:hypothetical protein
MKALYVSDDGKFFTTPEECMEYESAQKMYVVEVNNTDGDDYLTQKFESKQDCQHFVANYIHRLLESFESRKSMEEFFYNTKISVYHKKDKRVYLLEDLVEEVPAHYRIRPEYFHDLIR